MQMGPLYYILPLLAAQAFVVQAIVFPPPPTDSISCAAVLCGPGSVCRIVLDRRTQRVSPVCVSVSSIPQDNLQNACNIAGGPLLARTQTYVGKEIFSTFRCRRSCPAGLECTDLGVCCAPDDDQVRPGQCPVLTDVPCTTECTSDSQCKGNDKCCPIAKPGCRGAVCITPIFPATCAVVDCAPGFTCVEKPTGAECVPAENKPGSCPRLPLGLQCAPPGPDFQCLGNQCDTDSQCPGSQKCCISGCSPCRKCVDPEFLVGGGDCSRILCPRDRPVCIDSPTGARCVPRENEIPKPGTCPPINPGDVGICAITCTSDSECNGPEKCCRTACGGQTCTTPTLTCENVLCPVERPQCVETPAGPECRPRDTSPKPGNCPGIGLDDFGICAFSCRYDSDCDGPRKCCPTACGGTSCSLPAPSRTCANVRCAGRCIDTPTGPVCKPLRQKPGSCPLFPCAPLPFPPTCLDTCTNDFDCKGSDKCCRACSGCNQCVESFPDPGPCGGPCPPGQECVDTGLRCITFPCDGVYQCRPVDKCSLTPEPGPCRGSFTRYYYDASGPLPGCRTFTYGGCEGNANNFQSLRECIRACGHRPYSHDD